MENNQGQTVMGGSYREEPKPAKGHLRVVARPYPFASDRVEKSLPYSQTVETILTNLGLAR